MGPHHGVYNGMYCGYGFMWVLWAVLLACVVYFAVRYFTQKSHGLGSESKQNALALLQTRFAQGEIDKEEYQERKSILES